MASQHALSTPSERDLEAIAEALQTQIAATRAQIETQHTILEIMRRRLAAAPDARLVPALDFIDPLPRREPPSAAPGGPLRPAQRSEPTAGAPKPGWPSERRAAAPMTAPPGWSACSRKDEIGRTIGFAVFGLSDDELAEAVGSVRAAQCHEAFSPLFLTDSRRFDIFRDQAYAFEYIPTQPQPGMSPEDWRRRTLDRLLLVRRKWQLAKIIPFGRRNVEDEQLLEALSLGETAADQQSDIGKAWPGP